MKLVCLNLWGGKTFRPLIKFIKDISRETDLFCFQEVFQSTSDTKESRGVRANILSDLKGALPDFRVFVAPIGSGYDNEGPVDFDITESNAIFVKKNRLPEIDSQGSVFVRGELRSLREDETANDIPANFQYVRFRDGKKKFVICNIHGIHWPGDKKDTPLRLRQSEIIRDFLDKEDGAKVLCGDFNLLPDTKSIKTLEEKMINLIAKFEIKRTRSRLSPWFDKEDFQKFADYVFVSPEVNVINFDVPDVDISDHLPLILEFS